MKDYYTLPWTCKQADKAKYVIRWAIMIILPIVGIYGLILISIGNIVGFLILIFGIVFSAMIWSTAYLDEFITFPEFRCKTKGDSLT